jgi:ABC-type Fe3+-siderophore transport system permease subunit
MERMSLKERLVRGFLVSVVVGLAITLLSWSLRPPLSRMGVDVVMRGAPLPWMMQVIPMTGHILWNGFLADLVFWAAVIFGIVMAILHFGTGKVTHHEISKTQQY